MFTKNDFKKLDKKNFEIIRKTAYYIDLKSRLTGHTWSIYSKQLTFDRRSLEIRHRHSDEPFHIQSHYHPHNIVEAQSMILAHDIWHKNGRKK